MSDAQRKSSTTSRDRGTGRSGDAVSRPSWDNRKDWALDVGAGSLVPRADDPSPGIGFTDLPRRSIAFLIDFMLVQTVATVLLQMTGFIAGITLVNQTGVQDNALSAWLGFAIPTLAVGILIAIVYVFFLRSYGATPGQVVLGIHTVRASDGARLGTGRSVVRWLAALMPAWMIAGNSNIGVWWSAGIQRSQNISNDAIIPSGLAITLPVIWYAVLLVSIVLDRRGRGLHDRLAGSVVVREN